jgi:hypothetical protein
MAALDTPYYGVATTAWMGTPYDPSYLKSDAVKCGYCKDKTCNSGISDWNYVADTCATGIAGCTVRNWQCWQLTVTDDENIWGATNVEAGTTVNVAVIDNCEMQNSNGDNQQWCVPFTNVPSGGCMIADCCATTTCSDGTSLSQEAGSWNDDGSWDMSDCGSQKDFTCLNAAGYPAHFDLPSNPCHPICNPGPVGPVRLCKQCQSLAPMM